MLRLLNIKHTGLVFFRFDIFKSFNNIKIYNVFSNWKFRFLNIIKQLVVVKYD